MSCQAAKLSNKNIFTIFKVINNITVAKCKLFICLILLSVISKKINGQTKDNILISDPNTFYGITIHKSTIQDAVNKFGKYSKVKRVFSYANYAYTTSLCHAINIYHREF